MKVGLAIQRKSFCMTLNMSLFWYVVPTQNLRLIYYIKSFFCRAQVLWYEKLLTKIFFMSLCNLSKDIINLFVPYVLFLEPLKTSEIIQKKSASGSRTLLFVLFEKKNAPLPKSSVILRYFCVILRHFWVKLHKKCPLEDSGRLPWNSKLLSGSGVI